VFPPLLLVAGIAAFTQQQFGMLAYVVGGVCIAAAVACKVWGMRLASAADVESKAESETC